MGLNINALHRCRSMSKAAAGLYSLAPVWLQNVGISLYGLHWRHRRLGGEFEKEVEGFRERDRWDPTRMNAYVTEGLRRILKHAFAQVPHYRESFANLGISDTDFSEFRLSDLPLLPVLAKQTLRADPQNLLADDLRRSKKTHSYYTSGTTGTPIKMYWRVQEYRKFVAAREVRSFNWAGVSVRQSRSMIGGRIVVPKGDSPPPYHRFNRVERQLYFSAFHILPATVGYYVAALNRYRPQMLTGYAHSYYTLARMMEELGMTLDYEPDAAILGSEKLTPHMKDVIRGSLRTRAFEEYGAVENCLLATECEHGSLHVSPDFGIVEIVDEIGNPVESGQEGRIVVTGLLNETQPLVRYDIGDVGSWSTDDCKCGRAHLPVLKELVGRLEDTVIGPDGREMVRFHGIFVDLESVIEGQVIQEKYDHFTVRVVTTGAITDEDIATIRARFVERLGAVTVSVEAVREIPRTERGKFRAVISRLSEEVR